jgi:hypothetical protein
VVRQRRDEDLRSTINNSSLFSFTNGGIASSSWDEGTSTFTITAIPEPSTHLAALGLLALMLWPLRRKPPEFLNRR